MLSFLNSPRITCLSLLGLLALPGLSAPLQAQVHYHDNGSPWTQRARSGPDAEVPGWFYNLGLTGLRAELVADEPKALLVKYVFRDSPASRYVEAGDLIIGVAGRPFQNAHRNGYGMDVFGADGPIAEFAEALEECQGVAGKGKLSMILRRGNRTNDVMIDVDQKYGRYAAAYPENCPKSELILAELLEYLVEHQTADGSFGNPVHNTAGVTIQDSKVTDR